MNFTIVWCLVLGSLLFSCARVQKNNRSPLSLHELDGVGGLSGLVLEASTPGEFIFWSHSDRGPNAEPIIDRSSGLLRRPFLEPDFRPYWVKFALDKKTGETRVIKKINLSLSGLPNKKGDEIPVDMNQRLLSRDPNGIDPESMCFDGEHVWMGEEYGPSILKFTQDGDLLKRYSPDGRSLPKKILKRKLNRGFEGISCHQGKIYAILQSPLPGHGTNVLIFEFDLNKEKTERELIYPLFSAKSDKIGDLAYWKNHLYVIEQNSNVGQGSFHRIYRVNLLDADPRQPLRKELVVDLVKAGYDFADKVEGLVVLDDHHLAVINDNDFGVNGDKKTILGILEF